jgi:hypothetical protein
MKKKTLLTANFLLAFVLLTNLYSCKSKCKDCVEIVPAIAPQAIALQNINHLIDTTTSNAWIARYQLYKDSICNNKVGADSNVLSNGENFNKQTILAILCIKDCIGISIRYGMDSNFEVHQIISGISKNYTELLIPDSVSNDPSYRAETGQMPPCCP